MESHGKKDDGDKKVNYLFRFKIYKAFNNYIS